MERIFVLASFFIRVFVVWDMGSIREAVTAKNIAIRNIRVAVRSRLCGLIVKTTDESPFRYFISKTSLSGPRYISMRPFLRDWTVTGSLSRSLYCLSFFFDLKVKIGFLVKRRNPPALQVVMY